MTRIIGVVSGKGGVGKTTVVSNLGAVLAKRFGKKVTIVDANFTTSHLSLYLGMYYVPITLNKVLRGEATLEEATYNHFTGMKVVPASLSLSDLEGVDLAKLKDAINILTETNDIVFLDSGPGLGRESMACLRACDEVLYVTTPYVPSVIDIVRCEEVVNEIGVKPLGIVLNMAEGDKHEMSKEEIEQLTRLPVLATIPYDGHVKKALSEKVPVVAVKPNSSASKEFYKFAAHLMGEQHRSEGFFSRLFGAFRNP